MNYCNRCGGPNLNVIKGTGKSKSLEKSAESIIWSIVGITLSMLGIMIAVMALIKGFELSGEIVALFIALMFLLLLGINGLFLWQLLRLNGLAKEAHSASQLEKDKLKELEAKREQALIEPVTSATENTTRILEPRYEERRTK